MKFGHLGFTITPGLIYDHIIHSYKDAPEMGQQSVISHIIVVEAAVVLSIPVSSLCNIVFESEGHLMSVIHLSLFFPISESHEEKIVTK